MKTEMISVHCCEPRIKFTSFSPRFHGGRSNETVERLASDVLPVSSSSSLYALGPVRRSSCASSVEQKKFRMVKKIWVNLVTFQW